MKSKWLLISCLILMLAGILVVALLGVMGLVGFLAFRDTVQEEFSPLDATPRTLTVITPQPQDENPPSQIPNLSYIRVFTSEYSDDADADYEGIAIDISFYDHTSELIRFSNIPLTVIIELYAYRDSWDSFDEQKAELVYQGVITIDHSMRLGEMFDHYIRLPFSEIPIDRSTYVSFGTLKVIVETPEQGTFEDKTDIVLYPIER